MAAIDTAMGGVGTGVQPKDVPDPSAASPSAAAQTVANSLPPGSGAVPNAGANAGGAAPQPSAQTAPSPEGQTQGQAPAMPVQGKPPEQKEDEDLASVLDDLAGKKKPKKVEKAASKANSELDSVLDEIKSGGEPKSAVDWDSATQAWPDALKFMGAKFRAELGRDPKEQRQAFESMYGTDNVKTMNNALYFRSGPDQKFRKIDETLFNKMADFVLFKVLPNAAPTVANAAAQGLVDRYTGNVAAGGAAGGAADAVTRQAMISTMNKFSNIPQDSDHVSMKREILVDAGLNAAAPVGMKYAREFPVVKQAVDKLYGAFHSAGEAALHKAGEGIQKATAIRTAFREFKDAVLPGGAEQTAQETAEHVAGAIDAQHRVLTKNISVIETEAKALAEQKQTKVQFPNALKRLGKALSDYGYHVDPATGLVKQIDDVQGSLLSGSVKGATDELAAFMNRLTRENASGGSSLNDTFKYMKRLDTLSQFEKADPKSAEVRNLFRQVRNAAGQDRNAALKDLYEGSGLANEKVWKNAYDKYSQSIDAIGDFKAAFKTPQQKELMVDTLLKSSNPDRLEMLDGIRNVLGSDSKEWNSLRGSIYDNLLNKFSPHGDLVAADLVKFMNKPANQAYMSRIFSTEERGTLNRMAIEAQNLQKVDSTFGDVAKNVIKKGVGALTGMHDSPAEVVKAVMSVFGGNAKAINYMADEGFLEMAQQAQGPTIRRRLLESMDALDSARSKMKLIYPDKGVPLYIPVGGAALGSAAKQKITPMRPQYAPPSQSPQPME